MKKFRFLICSGPTRERIDPVRFISNDSTGTMGRCLNEAARKRKHRVTWVQCPRDAQSARELLKKLKVLAPKNDALVMAAAVGDVRPASVSARKIKKDALRALRLVPNPDILAELSRKKKASQAFVGFALESNDAFRNALSKLKKKKLEAIVLQKVTKKSAPFGDKKIGACVLEKDGSSKNFKSVSKQKLADFLIRRTEGFLLSKMRD